jgi:hypothetical protein
MRIIHLLSLLIFLTMFAIIKIPGAILWLPECWPDLYELGDLYRFSYLPEYRDTSSHNNPEESTQSGKTNLFVLGDSFCGPLKSEHFPGVRNYSFVNWNQFPGYSVQLKTEAGFRNVVLIECSEKHVLLRFSASERKRFLAGISRKGQPGFQLDEKHTAWTDILEKYAGRPAVSDQNIHMLLFGFEPVLALKECKAAFFRKFFRRIAPEVEEYQNKKMLLQRMTTDTDYLYMSSFRPLNQNKLDEIISGIREISSHYKQAGADSVILSIIPNPVSAIAPRYRGRVYNRLIPRIEARIGETGAGLISVFDDFSALKEKVYRRGDTHWNEKGERIWLQKSRKITAEFK